MSEDRDHYRTLGVPRDADSDDIKRAYRRQAKLQHPDTRGGDGNRFADLNEAYHTLRDSGRRRVHDRQLRQREGVSGFSDWVPHEDLDRFASGRGWGLWNLFDLFGGITGADQWWQDNLRRTPPVEMDLQLTPEEAAVGVRLPIELTHADLISPRSGRFWSPSPFRTVVVAVIPPGVSHGELFRYRFLDGDGENRLLQLTVTIVPG